MVRLELEYGFNLYWVRFTGRVRIRIRIRVGL